MISICHAANGTGVVNSGGKWGPSKKCSWVRSSRSTSGLSWLKEKYLYATKAEILNIELIPKSKGKSVI